MLVLHRRDCQGLDPRVVAQMVEPTFTDKDLLIILNTEDDAPAVDLKAVEQPATPPSEPPQPVPAERYAADSRSDAAPNVPELIVQRQYGKPVPTGIEIADQFAAGVEVPGDVQALAAELGLSIRPSHRGIEACKGRVLDFSTATMDAMHAVLLHLKTRAVEEMLR